MNLEYFFSLNKMIYPALTGFLFGLIYYILIYFMQYELDNMLLYLFVIFGFIIGNVIKYFILLNSEEEKQGVKK